MGHLQGDAHMICLLRLGLWKAVKRLFEGLLLCSQKFHTHKAILALVALVFMVLCLDVLPTRTGRHKGHSCREVSLSVLADVNTGTYAAKGTPVKTTLPCILISGQ